MAGTKFLFGAWNVKTRPYLIIGKKESITIPFSQVYELIKFSLSPSLSGKT